MRRKRENIEEITNIEGGMGFGWLLCSASIQKRVCKALMYRRIVQLERNGRTIEGDISYLEACPEPGEVNERSCLNLCT